MALKSAILALLVLLFAGAAATAFMAARREAAAVERFPPLGRFVDVGGRRVHYVQHGSGPDLVLIHGASGNLRDFTFDLMPRLTNHYRVTAFDRPGLGYTDRTDPAYSSILTAAAEPPAEQAALLRGAARALGIERPLVLGHSYGNAVALAWALDFPDDIAGIIDVSGVSLPWPGGLGLRYSLPGSLMGGVVLPPLVSAWLPAAEVRAGIAETFAPEVMPAGYATYLGAELVLRRGSFRANARQLNTLRPLIVAMSAQYADLSLPVEIIHGSADTIVPLAVHSARLSQIIPGANLVVIDGAGHMPHHTHPDATVAAIDRAAARAGLVTAPAN